MSLEFYQALGPDESKKALVHFPAGTFPGQTEALKDDTHHSNYGAHQLARCIVEGVRKKVPELAAKLRQPDTSYHPSSPDTFDKIAIPTSHGFGQKPEGS
ncbi:MAG: rhamnogalacturonan acetylesterase, partial [Akkermansiaceae bacterium]